MDWTRFTFDYRPLNPSEIFQHLISIEARKQATMSLFLPPQWRRELGLLNRIRTVHGSTALEGNPLTQDQVADFISRKRDLDPEGKALRQIQNADAAQTWVRDRFKTGRVLLLNDILHIHELVTKGSDETNNVPGRMRMHGVQVGTPALGGVHVGAPHQSLPRLMEGFVEFVNSPKVRAEHPVIRALLAHFFLVTLHPFGDGNGRVSRLVEAAILYEGGYNVYGFYGLSNYFYRHGDEYKTRLQESRRVQPFDIKPFIHFGLAGFDSELKGINNFIKTRLNRTVYRNTITGALDVRVGRRRRLLNAREYNLLQFLLDETEPADPFSDMPSERVDLNDFVDSPYVRAAYADVTTRTFLRELTRLDELGFIDFKEDPASGRQSIAIDLKAIEKDFDAW